MLRLFIFGNCPEFPDSSFFMPIFHLEPLLHTSEHLLHPPILEF